MKHICLPPSTPCLQSFHGSAFQQDHVPAASRGVLSPEGSAWLTAPSSAFSLCLCSWNTPRSLSPLDVLPSLKLDLHFAHHPHHVPAPFQGWSQSTKPLHARPSLSFPLTCASALPCSLCSGHVLLADSRDSRQFPTSGLCLLTSFTSARVSPSQCHLPRALHETLQPLVPADLLLYFISSQTAITL